MKRHLPGLIIVALLISACSGDKATATPRPAQAIDTPMPTATSLPPTATPLPPTVTPLPPTATPLPPTATPENVSPVIFGLLDQTVPDGESFPEFQLDDYVIDTNHADDEIAWSYAGNVDLEVRHIVVKGELTVKVPDDEWRGTETIRLEACDPGGLCDAVDVAFTVLDENDAPVLDVGEQTIFSGETFAEIVLAERVSDVDNPLDEITWSASTGLDLDVSITDGVLTVDMPDAEWRGSETIQLQACDVGGACGSEDIAFVVLDDSDPIIIHVSNEGFLIAHEGKKVLVDAIFQLSNPTQPPRHVTSLMENALPPFDDVDLVLTTHGDGDHVNTSLVQSHLENNPHAIFVSTDETVGRLPTSFFHAAGDRIRGIQLGRGMSTQLVLNGIELEIINLPHVGGRSTPNLGFIVSIGDFTLLHMGDAGEAATLAYLQAYELSDKEIDVALVPYFYLRDQGPNGILQGVQPRYIIPMHFSPRDRAGMNAMAAILPDAIPLYGDMERWQMSSSMDASTSDASERVNFGTEDDVMLAGTLFGAGETAVILGHMGEGGITQASWHAFARLIAEKGFVALTLDFRGRGRSEGSLRQSQLVKDMDAAVEFLRDRGYERIVCIGASMGGTACMRAAVDHDLDGLVVIASPMSIGEPTRVTRREIQKLTMPKLYVCAENDGYGLADTIEFMHEISPEPSQIKIFFDQSAHGTRLFNTDVGDEFRELLVSFLQGL